MDLEITQIDNAIVAIAKIVKHDEKVRKIKTATSKQASEDLPLADSVAQTPASSRAR
jgi:hypothetical protein